MGSVWVPHNTCSHADRPSTTASGTADRTSRASAPTRTPCENHCVSYDLAVWEGHRPADDADATHVFEELWAELMESAAARLHRLGCGVTLCTIIYGHDVQYIALPPYSHCRLALP